MSLASRLETLRRQAGVRVDGQTALAAVRSYPSQSHSPPQPTTHVEPFSDSDAATTVGDVGEVGDLQRRVNRLRRLLSRRDGGAPRSLRTQTPGATRASAQDRSLPGREIAPGLQLIESAHPDDFWPEVLALDPVRSSIQRKLASDPASGQPSHTDCGSLLAFDTETTGLAGGTGTRAFMIGVAHLQAGRIHVRQLLATTLGGEAAMLRTFLEWIDARSVLVSYNGRSYDRPLLSTRLQLARMTDPLPELQHLDLLHVTRRAYRGVWANCRLATAERELLGVLRTDDLPGSEAPAAWRNWLRGGPAEPLRRVALHNRQDLLSLFGLLRHFSCSSSAIANADASTGDSGVGALTPR